GACARRLRPDPARVRALRRGGRAARYRRERGARPQSRQPPAAAGRDADARRGQHRARDHGRRAAHRVPGRRRGLPRRAALIRPRELPAVVPRRAGSIPHARVKYPALVQGPGRAHRLTPSARASTMGAAVPPTAQAPEHPGSKQIPGARRSRRDAGLFAMSRPHRPAAADYRGLARLAAPIVLIQIGMMSMGVVDTIMVGRVSAAALAAVALANLFSFGIMIFGLGVIMALDPIISQALGARDHVGVSRGMQRGFLLATILTVPISVLLLAVEPVLELAGQPEEVIPLAAGYVYRTLGSVWPFYVFVVLRQTLQAHRRTAPIVVTIVAANALNAVLN